MPASEHVSKDQFPVLYHGTHVEEAATGIRSEGVRRVNANVIFPAKWPTLTTSREQAERYGKHVVEVHLTPELAQKHLWPELEHGAYGFDAKAYAVREHIPPEHVR
jgi:hypothetical protein